MDKSETQQLQGDPAIKGPFHAPCGFYFLELYQILRVNISGKIPLCFWQMEQKTICSEIRRNEPEPNLLGFYQRLTNQREARYAAPAHSSHPVPSGGEVGRRSTCETHSPQTETTARQNMPISRTSPHH